MSELILKKFETEDIDYIKGKNLYLISYFPSYITELYERYGYDGEIAGVFDLDEEKYGEKEVKGLRFTVSGMDEIKNCPKDSVLIITTGYFDWFISCRRISISFCSSSIYAINIKFC